jgi:hypothetical protein
LTKMGPRHSGSGLVQVIRDALLLITDTRQEANKAATGTCQDICDSMSDGSCMFHFTIRWRVFCSKKAICRFKNRTNDLTLDQWLNKLAEWQMSLISIRAHIPTCSGHNFASSSSQSYGMAFARSAQLKLYWLRFQSTPSWEASSQRYGDWSLNC